MQQAIQSRTSIPRQRVDKMVQMLRKLKHGTPQHWLLFKVLALLAYAQLGIQPERWQIINGYRWISDMQDFLDCRSRGGSKTHDGVLFTIFLIILEPGYEAGWMSGASQQLSKALRYAKRFHWRTWMGAYYTIGNMAKTQMPALFFDEKKESYLFFTITGTSGERAALQVYDEEGKIKKKHIKEANEEAEGQRFGAQGKIRERHITTLGLDTPAEDICKRLEPKGLVYRKPYDEISWIPDDEIERVMDKHAEWFINLEYRCLLDAPGGKIIKNFDYYTELPTKDLIPKGGIDWNPAWGHAGVINYTDGVDDYVFDEIRTTNLLKLARWITYWEYYKGAKFTAESAGGKTLNKSKDLREYKFKVRVLSDVKDPTIDDVYAVYLDDDENTVDEWKDAGSPRCHEYSPKLRGQEGWTDDIQMDRVSTIEGKSQKPMGTRIHCKVGLSDFPSQAGRWHYDEENPDGLPAKGQVDHHCDAYAHTVKNRVRMRFA